MDPTTREQIRRIRRRWETRPGLDINLTRPHSQQPIEWRCDEVDRRAHRRQASQR